MVTNCSVSGGATSEDGTRAGVGRAGATASGKRIHSSAGLDGLGPVERKLGHSNTVQTGTIELGQAFLRGVGGWGLRPELTLQEPLDLGRAAHQDLAPRNERIRNLWSHPAEGLVLLPVVFGTT